MKSPKDWSPLRELEMHAYDKLSAMRDELKAKYPEIGLSFGYIGNLETWGDDRHWYFFTEVLGEGNWGLQRINFGDFRTTELPKFLKEAREKLEPWIQRRLLPKLEKGQGGSMGGPKDWSPGPLSMNDGRVQMLAERIESAMDVAGARLWAAIAEAFPEIQGGDFTIESEVAWNNAVRRAVFDWLELNHPAQHLLKPILDEERRRS